MQQGLEEKLRTEARLAEKRERSKQEQEKLKNKDNT
jgi:hypothetical protein